MATIGQVLASREGQNYANRLKELEQQQAAQQQPQEETDGLDSAWTFTKNGINLFEGFGGILAETGGNIVNQLRPENPNHPMNPALGKVSELLHRAGDWLREDVQNIQRDDSNALTSVLSDVQSAANRGLEGFSRGVYADESAKAFENAQSKIENPVPMKPAELSFDYVFDRNGLPRNVAEMFGIRAPELAASFLIPGGAGANVARKIGGDALIRAMLGTGENALRRNLSKSIAAALPRATNYATVSAPFEAMIERGFTKKQALEDGKTPQEADIEGWEAFAGNLPILFAGNLAEGTVWGMPRFGGAGTSVLRNIGNRAKQIGARANVSGLQEGTTEALQNAVSNWAQGKDYNFNPLNWDDQQWREFRDAYAAALVMSGGAGVIQSVRPVNENEENYRRGADNNYSVGNYARVYDTRKKLEDARDAQIQAKVDRYEGDNYTGENGQAEGKYWERNPNMGVSFDGAQPELMNAIDKLAKYYYENTGKRLVINAGTNGSHADGEHSHAAGWKVDVVDAGGSDVSMSEDGPLFTAGYDKGPFLDEFIAYGRSIGLGMNLENLGTGNVHLDIALDGTQWDGNGENAGGFNPVNRGQVSEQNFEETADDPNFTEKQNEIWREAQYVASEAKKRFGYNIKPEWVYGQWSHEAGVNFDSKNARYNNNFGGLTQAEFNGEENKQPDGNNYYRTFWNIVNKVDTKLRKMMKVRRFKIIG